MKQLVRGYLRSACLGAFRLLGGLALWRFFNRDKVTILMLHGVAGEHPEAGWQPLWPRLTPADLDRVLAQLAPHYTFVALPDAVAMLRGERPPVRHALVLTFDDGYRNNLDEALPVLERHGARPTLFVATGFTGERRPYWIDRLDYALQKAPDDARLLHAVGRDFDLRGLDRAGLARGYQSLRLAVKNAVPDDAGMLAIFDELSAQLEAAAGTSIDAVLDRDPWAGIAGWDELRGAAGVADVGSHTVDHLRLDAIEPAEAERQLRESKAAVERELGTDCSLFCYPNGNYNAAVAALVHRVGYRGAVTTSSGLNAIGDDACTLRRYSFPNRATAFANRLAISGLREALRPSRHVDTTG